MIACRAFSLSLRGTSKKETDSTWPEAEADPDVVVAVPLETLDFTGVDAAFGTGLADGCVAVGDRGSRLRSARLER